MHVWYMSGLSVSAWRTGEQKSYGDANKYKERGKLNMLRRIPFFMRGTQVGPRFLCFDVSNLF